MIAELDDEDEETPQKEKEKGNAGDEDESEKFGDMKNEDEQFGEMKDEDDSDDQSQSIRDVKLVPKSQGGSKDNSLASLLMMQEIPRYESMKENIRGITKSVAPDIKIEHSDNSSKIEQNFLDQEMDSIEGSRENSLNQKTAERLNKRI